MPVDLPTQAHTYLDSRWEANLETTRAFLRQRSISAQSVGLRETADGLRAWLEARGGSVSYHGDASRPIVFGEWNVGAPRTLLVYGMYDVQPVDGQVWTTPPFAAEIVDHVHGARVVARGACNSKGPLMAMMHAIDALRATGGLPVNLKWTIEGEEEIGSQHLPDFYETNQELLRADAAFEPFWGQHRLDGPPVITLGTKGVIGLEFVCQSGDWGGPRGELHSSDGAWIASPAWRLMQALTTLVDEFQELTVDGLPALGQMLPGDEALLQKMAQTFDGRRRLEEVGAARFKRDLPPYELLRQAQFAPALNINGLESGYQGAGSHTIIPSRARALADLRLAPGMEVAATFDAITAHLARRGFGDIQVSMDSGYPAARTPLDAPVIQALTAAYNAHGFEPIIRPVEPSATPYYLFTDVLGLNFAWGGLGTAAGSHGPDEWCSVDGLRALEKSLATFLVSFASVSGTPAAV
jgi:acetylornithine deacetylase/succinyl-diaminopimelate desuccinylase-like protein